MPDGSMLMENEMSLMPLNERGDDFDDELNAVHVGAAELGDDVKKIPIGILHSKLGAVWESTGTPIGSWFIVTDYLIIPIRKVLVAY